MIPRKIHYCWFGGNPLPELAQKCIASWKKHCPDFEIVEWNESNYDVHKNPYIAQAYEQKKYAFVSDYMRFDILHRYGGVYLD
ncbi:MAG: glycosyl transferase, partial [Clostridia bacterium]|nr:glycosyl transferase [Clostridia bacterium]